MTKRLLPSVQTVNSGKAITVFGRTYTAAAGTTQDVPDQDAAVMSANGWLDITGGGQTGATSARPTTGLVAGLKYLDTTLGYVVIYDGATWRNPSSGASV